jgi:hypothetical protein
MKNYGLWDDAPDVEWGVSSLGGVPLLVIQSTNPLVAASLLGQEFRTVDPRIIFDNSKLPDLVPGQFTLSRNGALHEPILVLPAPLDPALKPILDATEKKKEWLLFLQLQVQTEDGKHEKKVWGYLVRGDDTCESAGEPLDYWPVVLQ